MNLRYVAAAMVLWCAASMPAHAVRVMTTPATATGDPAVEFDNFTLSPDGNTIVAVGIFDTSLVGDVVYTLPVPANPNTDTVAVTRIVQEDFVTIFDANGPPVVSPDGSTVLYTNDSRTADEFTIHKLAIGGSDGPLNGLFSNTGTNNVASGFGNFNPRYSADGSTIYFINGETGFGGTVPDFEDPEAPSAWDDPDWDQLFSVPAAGGTPTAITTPADGDLDANLWAPTPSGNIVYAPDTPIIERRDRGGQRSKIFSVPAVGGASTEIPLATPSASTFTIQDKLAVTPDGSSILFIGDYETVGKFELFSVPIAGGMPTRVNDDLPFAGDVTSFEISPDGTKVAYAAGQNVSSNNELFLKDLAGTAGSSVRVSDPASVNGGQPDVSRIANGGISFSNDGSQLFYLGDFENNDVFDLYVVDTSEKAGIVPSHFTYVGAENGDFFDENNWEDAGGNSPPVDTINPDTAITHSLLIDGDTVGSTGGGQVDFGAGGSLELTAGSILNLTNPGDQLDFNPDSGLKITDATINVDDDIVLEGTNFLVGGTIESIADDIEFQDAHSTFISGTTLISGDNIFFDNSSATISGATFQSADRLGLRFNVELTVTDTTIDIQGGAGDIDDIFTGNAAEGTVLTLKGASALLADSIAEGVDVVLEDSSIATFGGLDFDVTSDNVDEPPFFPWESRVIVNSLDAIVILTAESGEIPSTMMLVDLRPFIINGLTGMSYADDPSAWNVTNWDGTSALATLRLAGASLAGDFDGDGDVDGADFLAWQRGESPDPLSPADLATWQSAYNGGALAAAQVPEPTAALLVSLAIGLVSLTGTRRR